MKSSLIKKTATGRTVADLKRLQELPLDQKVNLSLRRIKDFITMQKGKVYVSFSGGKDSTVLLDLVRQVDPTIEAVFVDTGLEFQSVREFARTTDNTTVLRPKMRFDKVIDRYGYPVISKEVSNFVATLQNPTPENERTRKIRLEGSAFKGGKANTGKLSEKWHFLKDSPFKCHDKCCSIMKKQPARNYGRETGKAPFIGTMASESSLRQQLWLKSGCNMYDNKTPQSTPLAFWTDSDVWEYIKARKLDYADIYDKGAKRTGCVFCLFGYWSKNDHKTDNDRMDLLKRVEPKKYEYCMKDKEDGGLGLRKVIDYIDKKLAHGQQEFKFD
ncbi:MAG: phosphoadenosine phosphosulfate reductase family protein [Colwellia sp.]|nr:phosphoadenosine phosphosulfate reductase family protein [Colwellia sp.]